MSDTKWEDQLKLIKLQFIAHDKVLNTLIENWTLQNKLIKASNAMLQDYEIRLRKLEEIVKEYEDTFAIQKYTRMTKN